jgi:hypothetical protein
VSIRRRETKAGVRYDMDWRLPDGSKRITWKTDWKKHFSLPDHRRATNFGTRIGDSDHDYWDGRRIVRG